MTPTIGTNTGSRAAVLAIFVALSLAACSAAATPAPTAAPTAAATVGLVNVAQDPTLGAYLTGAGGMSLYQLTKDSAGASVCTGTCATNWKALVVTGGGAPTAAGGVTGTLATFTRADGGVQVTYNGVPLYYYIKDTKAGDILGQTVNSTWFLATPASTATGGAITGGAGQAGFKSAAPAAVATPAY